MDEHRAGVEAAAGVGEGAAVVAQDVVGDASHPEVHGVADVVVGVRRVLAAARRAEARDHLEDAPAEVVAHLRELPHEAGVDGVRAVVRRAQEAAHDAQHASPRAAEVGGDVLACGEAHQVDQARTAGDAPATARGTAGGRGDRAAQDRDASEGDPPRGEHGAAHDGGALRARSRGSGGGSGSGGERVAGEAEALVAAQGVGLVEVVALGEVGHGDVVQRGDDGERLAALDDVRRRIGRGHLGGGFTRGRREGQEPREDGQQPRGVEVSHGRRP